MCGASTETFIGQAVATLLTGAWRGRPQPLDLDPNQISIGGTRLLSTGGGGLGWLRLRHCLNRTSYLGRLLREAHRHNLIRSSRYEEQVQDLLSRLATVGVEAILVKGWTVARLYPDPGMRPCGDVDLCVRPDQFQTAVTILHDSGGDPDSVDLHQGVADLEDRGWEQIVKRSRLVPLGEVRVRVLGPEDQLRHLCLHLLRHGAWRPVWLCDVAAALESLPADFDWEYFLHGHSRLTEWVACAIDLARELLGARVDYPDWAETRRRLPTWMVAALLRQWGALIPGDTHTRDSQPMASYFRQPAGLWKGIGHRWPNPIEATFKMKGRPSTRMPRLLFQLGSFLRRATRFTVHPTTPPDRDSLSPSAALTFHQ